MSRGKDPQEGLAEGLSGPFSHETLQCRSRFSPLQRSRHPVGYEVLVCSKALLGVILGVSWLNLAREIGRMLSLEKAPVLDPFP